MPRSSETCTAQIQVDGVGNCEVRSKGKLKQFQPIDALSISPRIGSTARQIAFPDGALFESRDNDEIDALLVTHDKQRFNRLAHFLESNSKAIVAVALCTAVSIWLVAVYAVPSIAKKSASALPASAVQALGKDTFTFLDKNVLKPSELPAERQQELQQQLLMLLPYADPSMTYRLKFRKLPGNRPNAFALPDGTMVIGDALVELSTDDNQLLGVLAHEMGHIEKRHHIRQAIEGQGLFLVMVLVTGDIASFTNLVVALPSAILRSSFSRDMETEADEYAADMLQAVDIPAENLADILTLLDEYSAKESDTEETASIFDYLSSHPGRQERLQNLLEYSATPKD